jgi:hypothetical protein
VLQADQSGILRRLLKFPPVEDVHILVNMAVKYMSRGVQTFKPITRPEVVATPFAASKKIISEKVCFSTNHSGKPAIIALADEAIQLVNEIISE